jgi:hypothetical protein
MMDNNQKDNNGQLNIELPEETAEGTYSNLSVITHSNSEFVLDFIQMMPGVPKAKVKSRVVMSPQNAKRLLRALQDNVNKFEQANGHIKDLEPAQGVPMNFGGPTTEA